MINGQPHASGVDSAPRDWEMLGVIPAEMDVHHVVHIHATVLQEKGKFDQRFGSAAVYFLWSAEHYFGCCSLIFLHDHKRTGGYTACVIVDLAFQRYVTELLYSARICGVPARLNRHSSVSISIIKHFFAVCNLIIVRYPMQTFGTQGIGLFRNTFIES